MAAVSGLSRTISRDRFMRLRVVAWGLALCPLLFVPPIAAIAIAWRAPGQRSSAQRFDPTWITIVAILNLAISAGVIHRLGLDMSSLMSGAQRMLVAPPSEPGQPHLQSI